jgi:hypothetical protein
MSFFKKRGFLLVFALMLTVLVAIIALGLLGVRRGNYAASKSIVNSIQARSLAQSGMNDIWAKLSADPYFPTGIGDEQIQFAFREEVIDSMDREVGSYTVRIDRRYRQTHKVVLLESTGISGGLDANSSTFTIYAELSTEVGEFEFKVWHEGTSPRL